MRRKINTEGFTQAIPEQTHGLFLYAENFSAY